MERSRALRGAAPLGALATIFIGLAAPAAAQYRTPYQGPQTVFRGWDCSRCSVGVQYCVVNVVRFEYACAPLGTFACAGFSGTRYCRYGSVCWDGNCR